MKPTEKKMWIEEGEEEEEGEEGEREEDEEREKDYDLKKLALILKSVYMDACNFHTIKHFIKLQKC